VDTAKYEVAADQLTIMSTASEGIKNTITLALLPATVILADKFTEAATNAKAIRSPLENSVREAVRMVGAVVAVGKLFLTLQQVIRAVGLRIVAWLVKPIDAVERGLRQLIGLIPGMGDQIRTQRGFISDWREQLELAAQASDDYVLNFEGVFGEMDAFVGRWDDAVQRTNATADATARKRDELSKANSELLEYLQLQREEQRRQAEAAKFWTRVGGIINRTQQSIRCATSRRNCWRRNS